jgi:hypothetical protein
LAQDEQFRELLRQWAEQEGGRARCVITCQVAGYTGSPVTGACEVELQTFTADDVSAVIGAWNLPADTAAWLRSRVRDRAIAMMARIPLLLALMCSLSASPAGVDLTRIRGQFLDRMLRWFSTRMHRRPDDIGLSMPKLAGQEGRGVTEALIDLLADPRQSVRQAAISALAAWEGREATDALLTHPDLKVRQLAAEALGGHEAAQVPSDWTRGKRGPDRVYLPLAIRLAERLTTRDYHKMDPSEQRSLRVAITWLIERA